MELQIKRLGGIAGVALHHRIDTADLPSEETAKVERAVRELSGQGTDGPSHPDAFRYEITPLGDPDLAPIVLGEREVPPELAGLVRAVSDSGKLSEPG